MALQPHLYSDARPPRRDHRHLRTAITLLVLLVIVSGAGWYSWNLIAGESEADEDPNGIVAAPTCAVVAPTGAPPPEDIGLNVYNATDRNGLASSVAREMRERGYAILDVANDPTTRTVTQVAEVRANVEQQLAVDLVMSQFPGSVFLPDERTDGSIDLALGEAFEAIAAIPAPGEPAAPEGTATPLPVC